MTEKTPASFNHSHSGPQLISGPNIPSLKLMHEDERRAIREAALPQSDGTIRRVTHLTIKGAGVLGQHYHPIPERFTVVSGDPVIATAPHDDTASVVVQRFPEGGHITMASGQVHAFEFGKEGGELISTMDGAFDPSQLIPAEIVIPPEHRK